MNILTPTLLPALPLHWETDLLPIECLFIGLLHMHTHHHVCFLLCSGLLKDRSCKTPATSPPMHMCIKASMFLCPHEMSYVFPSLRKQPQHTDSSTWHLQLPWHRVFPLSNWPCCDQTEPRQDDILCQPPVGSHFQPDSSPGWTERPTPGPHNLEQLSCAFHPNSLPSASLYAALL